MNADIIDNPTDDQYIRHFVYLANSGASSGASGGQVAARELALAILEHATRLDERATMGLVQFICIARMRPEFARSRIVAEVSR